MTSALTPPPPPRFTISLTQKKIRLISIFPSKQPLTPMYVKQTGDNDICQKLWEAPGAPALNF